MLGVSGIGDLAIGEEGASVGLSGLCERRTGSAWIWRR